MPAVSMSGPVHRRDRSPLPAQARPLVALADSGVGGKQPPFPRDDRTRNVTGAGRCRTDRDNAMDKSVLACARLLYTIDASDEKEGEHRGVCPDPRKNKNSTTN